MERIDYSAEKDLANAGIIEVATKDGRRRVSRVDKPLGHLSRPLSRDRIVEKFLDCAKHAARPLSPKKLQEVVKQVDSLEQAPDVTALTRLLGGALSL